MAIVSNTYLTFDSKGNREQLANTIYSISPEETPIVSQMAKENAKGVLFEWQTDALAAVDSANAVLQGDDVTSFAAVTPTVRVGNYTNISRKTLIIAGTQEAIEKAGRSSELAYQTAKRGKEMKRDIEAMILQYNSGGVAGASTTIPRTAGLLSWVKSNDDFGATGASPVYTSGVPGAGRTDGTQRAFTETILKSVLQTAWTSGADVNKFQLFVGPVNKQKVSAFSGVVTRNYDISKPKPTAVIAAADVYVSDFGTISVMPSRWQRERDAWFLDFEYLALAHLRPFKREPLAKTGDSTKLMLLQEWGLKVRQEAALGLAADLTTT